MKMPNVKQLLRRKEKIIISRPRLRHPSRASAMTSKTREFIQRLCNRKSPSVDMTRNGFVSDRKTSPAYLMFRPLKTQLEKIIGFREKTIQPRVRNESFSNQRMKPYIKKSRASYGTGSKGYSFNSLANKTSTSVQAGPVYVKRKKKWR